MPNPQDQSRKITCDSHPEVTISVTPPKFKKPGVPVRLSINDIKCKFYSFDWGENRGFCTLGGKKEDCGYA
jgi:hypothetical protein